MVNYASSHPKRASKFKVILLITTLLIVTPLIFILVYGYELTAPSSSSQKAAFAIEKGESTDSIITRLAQGGFIRSPLFYKLYLMNNKLSGQLQAGDFILNKADDAKALTEKLLKGTSERKLTVIEGWRVEEIGEYLEKQGFKFKADEFTKKAKALEGKLFPDTYFVSKEATSDQIISRLNEEFKEKFAPLAGKGGSLTDDEVVILASIVEREARDKADKKMVAGILRNRLNRGIALETDATIQYILGNRQDKDKWWPTITAEQTKSLTSPYNTYLNAGLPEAPISNPSWDSLEAVVSPTESDNFYYLHGKDGNAYYSKTIEEHIDNQKKYL